MKKLDLELKKVTENEKIRLIAGITLIAQAAAFGLLCLILWGKKRSLAKAFGAAAAVGGISGAFLLLIGKKKCCPCREEEQPEEDDDFFGDSFDEDDVFCNFETDDDDCCCGACDEETDIPEPSDGAEGSEA